LDDPDLALGETGEKVTDYEIVLVVDGSPDDTAQVATELTATDQRVRTFELRRNYGQHNALLAGILRARFDIVVTMDDDLQHRASDIPKLLEPLLSEQVDLVYGVSKQEEHGFLRSFASRSVKRGLRSIGVPNATDMSAFRAFRLSLRDAMDVRHDPYVSIDVLLSWATTREVRVLVDMDERQEGKSSYHLGSLIRHAMNMVTGYSTVPLRLVTVLGSLFSLLGMALLIYILVNFFLGHTSVAGYTSTVAVIAVFSGAQMMSLGVLGEYIGRLHARSMRRPTFLVRDQEGGSDAV
jgi:undecaprenyl-phosphate 4-deoxy-4-formamido-L-arabinose transferase